jgi:hypothetical protein
LVEPSQLSCLSYPVSVTSMKAKGKGHSRKEGRVQRLVLEEALASDRTLRLDKYVAGVITRQ